MTKGSIAAGENISSRFRKALPHLPESNAQTLAKIIDIQTRVSELVDILRIIVANSKIIPDPSMQGATDIYAVPLEDIETAKILLNEVA